LELELPQALFLHLLSSSPSARSRTISSLRSWTLLGTSHHWWAS
jgi:hypothetical protein